MVTLREAQPADAPAIHEVVASAAREQGPWAYTEREVEAWAHVEDPPPDDPIEDDDSYLVVAEADGKVVGVGDLAGGEIRAVYVRPGRIRQGVETRLLDELEPTASDGGHDEVSLHASLNAVPFYERRGYDSVERVTHETSTGVELDVVLMTKPLG
jgi:GNAT superfamily N-acetyltransferase